MIKSKFLKAMLGLALVVVTSAGYVSTASAKLSGQVSQGKGIKCYFVSTTSQMALLFIHKYVVK